jgi:gamma-glutamylputrescine oxidase
MLARALTGEGGIPEDYAGFGLSPTFGSLGRWAAQATYWWLQGRDTLRERFGGLSR